MKSEQDRVTLGGKLQSQAELGERERRSFLHLTSPAPGLAEGISEVGMEPSQYQQIPSSSVPGRTFPAQCLLCARAGTARPQLMSQSGCTAGSRSPRPASRRSPAQCHRNPGTSPSALPPARTVNNQQLSVRMFHPQPTLPKKGSITTLIIFQTQQTPPGLSTHPTGARTNPSHAQITAPPC